jgi:hypothetical protein
MARRKDTAGAIADGLAELQRLVCEDYGKTPEEARAAGYVPVREIVPGAAAMSRRTINNRLGKLRTEGKIESIKVVEDGNNSNWWRVVK